MADDRSWLSDIILIKEGADENEPGWVDVFLGEEAALQYLEPWWVKGSEGVAFSAAGERLVLSVDADDQVVIERREPCDGGKARVLNWLRLTAEAGLEARREKGDQLAPFEQEGRLPATTEGLLAYIGVMPLPAWPLNLQEPLWSLLTKTLLLFVAVFFLGLLGFWVIATLIPGSA